MGNCMETCMQWQIPELQHDQQKLEEEEKKGSGFVEESDLKKSGMRVKVVLTKEELEWLILELKRHEINGGKRSLEDVLDEIHRARGGSNYVEEKWRPSLDSIMEGPELPEMDR